MPDYNHREVEARWQRFWDDHQTFRTETPTPDASDRRPKYYVLDMFPYPSGAGLHVGHPLGYIASDIVARYKRLRGYNVLHPMGFDSFGLPAEQYAIQTGQHPALTTEQNIETYTRQLRQIGLSYDWSREVRTSDPGFYKWTQWIFGELFNSWYNRDADKAEPIQTLLDKFAQNGTTDVNAVADRDDGPLDAPTFTAEDWQAMAEEDQHRVTLAYRLTFLADAVVNWCPALGTVLANDEVKDGLSERGGYPVEQKKMRQWMMRITAYADRLLTGLDRIDWSESIKEQQRNWIGKSVGAMVRFDSIDVFTTRVDTLYGVTFLVLAPEHELVNLLTTDVQRDAVTAYVQASKLRSERDRMADVKTVSGVFTGSYARHPLTHAPVPIYLADYVLAGYGTGAVMAVPSGDQRDYLFANQFDLPIVPVLDGQQHLDQQADPTKSGRYINSGIIDGMTYAEAGPVLIGRLEALGAGKGKVNFRLRDAVFSRQRYWGEPVPIYFKDDVHGPLPYLLADSDLPLELPAVDKYLPTETGEPPLARAEGWQYQDQFPYELSTMPGWAGSSFYWYRYMDPQNAETFASRESIDYWQDVDLYMGGSEHATGHLMYSRFWNKFLYDRGYVPQDEPFKKLINQGMIQGRSALVYRLKSSEGGGQNPVFVSAGLKDEYETTELHADVNIVENDVLDTDAFRNWLPDYRNAEFILENGKYVCGSVVEKMSKRYFNVVNPDVVAERYGADVLRLYEMFLGPLEQAKPWNTNGIDGTFRFIKKLWRLFYTDNADGSVNWLVTDAVPTPAELKILHRTIKKIGEDIDNYSFNTSVSAFMICVNELATLKCNSRSVLQDLVILLSPFAPHVCEELWAALGHEPGSISRASFPVFEPKYLTDNVFEYPIQINGKVRTTIEFGLGEAPADMERTVLANEVVQKWLDGKTPKKVVVVPQRIVNVVL
jgi:leucyl-tRNA synthetase